MEAYIPVLIAAGVIILVMIVVLGVQIYVTLAELRITLQKANKVLDDAGVIEDSIIKIPELLTTLVGQAGKGVMDRILPAPSEKKKKSGN